MKRLCIINVAGLSGRLLAGGGEGLRLNGLASPPMPMRSVLPAVTCTVQASLTTGVGPSGHGIVANGLYLPDKSKVSFWEQSNELLGARRFWQCPQLPEKPKVAMLFWQNSMAGAADIVVTPKPKHLPDGRTVSWCHSQPGGLYESLVEELGEFDLMSFWGPMASIKSSQWIARCAVRVWQDQRPDLQLVYLPHLDYNTQRVGPDGPGVAADVRAADELVGGMIDAVTADGGECIICSEYGLTPVTGAGTPNLALREGGLLAVREEDGQEYLDIPGSRAFAMVDHQVAHVYCVDDAAVGAAAAVLAEADAVGSVLTGEAIAAAGLGHPRSGQVVLLAKPDQWFAYYWWADPTRAPGFARTVDIHRKPGYDPCELFVDPQHKCIPCQPELVKGSHGLTDCAPADRAVLAATCPLPATGDVKVTDLPGIARGILLG